LRCRKVEFKLEHAVALVDFKRLPKLMQWVLLEHTPYGSQRNLGASTLEWVWIAANRGHVYLHGGMKLWDLAAGTLILAEAGGYSSGIDGEPVSLTKLANSSVVASPDQALFTKWLAFLQTYNDNV
jgi:myo-inositol-1(or 4)-monophosphatase